MQKQASNPNHSVWVSASAGTGKTKILTDRVVRLMLQGVELQKILCLTFTNAAANEMQQRIINKAKHLSTLEDKYLCDALTEMTDIKPNAHELENAKKLYAKLIDSQEQVQIHTIHSFCQKLLKRFPIEAGVAPSFKIMDTLQMQAILSLVKNELYKDESAMDILDFFISNFHEKVIDELLEQISNKKLQFQEHSNIWKDDLYEFGSGVIEEIENSLEQIRYNTISILKTLKIESLECFDVREFFLTQMGEKKSKLLKKELAEKYPALLGELAFMQEQTYLLDQRFREYKLWEYSTFLYKLAVIFIEKYETYKTKHGLLDYTDLIYKTKLLLTNSTARDWVLYKLDGGIDHLLVDEAQDTSKEQWEIIDAIITEFYSGDGAYSSEIERTIFVVGDEKQSIFSFQGADSELFASMRSNFIERMGFAGRDFKIINLEYSYRSLPAILNLAYKTFENLKSKNGISISENPEILPFRNSHFGTVEVWPLIEGKKIKPKPWSLPEDLKSEELGMSILASQIAQFVSQIIDSKVVMPSTGMPIHPSDIMILFRKRDKLTLEVIKQLQVYGLDVCGIDRMNLHDDLSVRDLISIAKFTINPRDTLNNACLLKSAIFRYKDEDLQNIKTDEIHVVIEKFLLDKQISTNMMHDVGLFFLNIVDGLGFRKTLLDFNGEESNDAINEFLYLTHNYANNIENSLQSFIYWFENNEIEIKRNLEISSKIRVMTVHGSKGLQSPMVILCDTTSIPIGKDKFVWTDNKEFVGVINNTNAPKFLKSLKQQIQNKSMQEYYRLLYVAITRSQDHLVICGYHSNNKPHEDSWYSVLCQNSCA